MDKEDLNEKTGFVGVVVVPPYSEDDRFGIKFFRKGFNGHPLNGVLRGNASNKGHWIFREDFKFINKPSKKKVK